MAQVTLTSTRARQQLKNAAFGGAVGALSAADRGAFQAVPVNTGNPHDSNDYVYRWRQYTHLYEVSWEARKIIRIIPEDALRKPWMIEDMPEEFAKPITRYLERLKFERVLRRSLMLERLLGGALTFMGLESEEDEPEKEYHPKEGQRLCFLNAVPVSRIQRVNWCTDPLKEGYMRPDMYMVNGQEVHVSRFLVWDGDPLFDPYDFALTHFRSNLAGFGPSVLAPIWDDVVKAVGTRQAAYQLIQTNNAILAAVSDLQDLSGTKSGQAALKKVKDVANQLSVYRAALIDGEGVDIKQHSASFGSVPELIITFIQILSAASDIPATRFLGQAPGGLNATGESDLENYYNVIDAYQRQRIEPELRRVYDVVGYHLFRERWKKLRDEYTIKFPPLWNASELEEAQKVGQQIDNVLKLYEQNLMSEEKVLEELNAKGALSVELDPDDLALLDDADGGDPNGGPGGGEPGGGARGARTQPKQADMKTSGSAPGGTTREGGNGASRAFFDQSVSQLRNAKGFTSTTLEELIQAAGGDSRAFDLSQVEKGMAVEQEHADVTHGDAVTTMKIVLAHLTEKADYYDRLEKVENRHLDPLPTPTEAQKGAGNYPKHHLRLHGLDISIENPWGSERSGVGVDGKPWSSILPAHYGYVKRTEGADGDHVDVYVGPHEESETVYVVDQLDPDTKEFDEHKCIFGALSMTQAKGLYLAGFSDGRAESRLGAIHEVPVSEFKVWLKDGNTKAPYQNQAPEEWYGVDFDGTLTEFHGWDRAESIGAPIPAMVERVKQWLAEGKKVKVLTARAASEDAETAVEVIRKWTEEHLGQPLEVTSEKDPGMVELWDDRAVAVETNTGKEK